MEEEEEGKEEEKALQEQKNLILRVRLQATATQAGAPSCVKGPGPSAR